MKYAFFPGCSLESTAWDYNKSTQEVCRALGIEIEEIPDWVCCGSTPGHTTNESLATALPAFNLEKAQTMGLNVMTACASCYSRLRTANHKIRNNPEERERAERVIEKTYDGSIKVIHILDLLINHFGFEKIQEKVQRPLKGLKVACYYGCLLTRPPEVAAFDNTEHPRSMDDIMTAAGAETVDWPYKTECCGASLSITKAPIVNRLAHKILSMAQKSGAECVSVACPLCQINLDMRQADSKKVHGDFPNVPVFYVTQLLGLALGLSPKDLGIKSLMVSPDSILKKFGVDQAADSGGV